MNKQKIFSTILVLTCSCVLFAKNGNLPSSPSLIPFKTLDWKVPMGEPYRIVLKNGLVAYIAEDRTLPLVSISGYIKYGSVNDPAGKEGLCSLLADLLRTGGTQKYQSDSLDAIIDLYAFNVKIESGETRMQFKFSCLSENLDLCMDVMQQMLFHPVFEEKKIKKSLDLFTEDIYHRFDNPGPVLGAAYEKAMYSGSANSRLATINSIKSLTRNDLIKLHQNIFKTSNMICAVSGKFSKDSMALRLTSIFPKDEKSTADPVFPDIRINSPQKIICVNKTSTQSYVKMGLPFIKRPNDDYYAVSVLNMILGGESFTSRLCARIRSDEGLTYSIHSNAESNYFFPGTFYIEFHTKSESTCRAIALSLEEIQRLKTKRITKEELDHAKKILIDGFPSMFRSPEDIVENYSMNEYFKRPANHYKTYPGKINELTIKDIMNAADKYLDPAAFTYTIVGDTTVILRNDTVSGFSLRKLKPSLFIEQDSLPLLP